MGLSSSREGEYSHGKGKRPRAHRADHMCGFQQRIVSANRCARWRAFAPLAISRSQQRADSNQKLDLPLQMMWGVAPHRIDTHVGDGQETRRNHYNTSQPQYNGRNVNVIVM